MDEDSVVFLIRHAITEMHDSASYDEFSLPENFVIPYNIYDKLSKDTLIIVRIFVAKNNNTPIDILLELSKDEDPSVCYYVAENTNTSLDILIELSKHEDYHVRRHAKQNRINRLLLLK